MPPTPPPVFRSDGVFARTMSFFLLSRDMLFLVGMCLQSPKSQKGQSKVIKSQRSVPKVSTACCFVCLEIADTREPRHVYCQHFPSRRNNGL